MEWTKSKTYVFLSVKKGNIKISDYEEFRYSLVPLDQEFFMAVHIAASNDLFRLIIAQQLVTE